MEEVETITNKRKRVAEPYHKLYGPYEKAGVLRIPHHPDGTRHNGHAVFVIFDSSANRDLYLALLREKEVHPYIGYLPLHSSKMGARYGYKSDDLSLTESLASRIVRLPLYADLADNGLDYCLESMQAVLKDIYRC